MTIVNRFLFPVGHGGFAAEAIENKYLAVIDCGSDVCPTRVSMYIDEIKKRGFNCVNRLFITHFDKDHVNCIKELINNLGVREVVIPFIPHEMRYVYNIYTKGAYLELLGLFNNHENRLSRENNQGNGIELTEVDAEETFSQISQYDIDIWEWNVKCLLTVQDWNDLGNEFIAKSLDIDKLKSSTCPDYLEQKKETINACFKSVFGRTGPNSKGLIVLSQKCKNVNTDKCMITQGCSHSLPATNTGCLYTGDAKLKGSSGNEVKSFIDKSQNEQMMLLTQIPHHGSNYNTNKVFATLFDSEYYFYCDNTDKRLRRNKQLYDLITNKLLDVRDCNMDLIWNHIVLK